MRREMGFARDEKEIAKRISVYLKGKIADAGLSHGEMAALLEKHGHPSETADSVKHKLRRGTFPATFLLAVIAALGLSRIDLKDI